MSKAENKSDKAPDDFIIGLVAFGLFIIFMTIWMYVGNSE